jgi:hypothetical protein
MLAPRERKCRNRKRGRRYECNKKGRNAHAQKRGNERRLAANEIAVMTENCGADGSSHEADKIGAECREGRRQWLFIGKVKLAEDQPGGNTVDEEVRQ